MRTFAVLAAVYVALVIAANWLASTYVVHVPLTPYMAPAGVFAIGAILVLRDWMQQLRGLRWTMPLVYLAGLISWEVGNVAGWTDLQKIAVASVIAFTVSETVEALVFTPLRKRHLSLAVTLSSTVALVLDSWIFLTIAFGSLAFFWGQFFGKFEMVVVGGALTLMRRRLVPVAA